MSKAMVGRRANAVVSKSSIHHRILPWCEHVGETLGESKILVASPGKDCSSSSSTITCDASISASAAQDDDGDTSWTDDKHSSYLSCMEEMFVRNMYDREYCAPDICGEPGASCEQSECVESKLPTNFFKVMQGGGWQPLPCRRLHSWELPSPSPLTSPWIEHFKAKPRLDESGGATPGSLICKTSTAFELEDEEDAAEVPDVENTRSSAWLQRMNSSFSASTTSSSSYSEAARREDESSAGFTGNSSSALSNNDAGTTTAAPARRSSGKIFETIDQVVPLVKKRSKRCWSPDTGENRSCWASSRMNIVRR